MADEHVDAPLHPVLHSHLALVGSHGVGLHHRHPEPVPGEDVVHTSGDAPGARVRGAYQHPPSLHPPGGHRVDERALLRVELLLRRPKSSLTVAATNIGDGTKAPGPFDVRLANVRLNGRLLHSMRQWKRPSPAPGAALRKFFCGWQGRRAARRPSGRRPSRFPRPRVPLRGAHINPCGPSGGQQALHQYQTQGDAHEATRSGIARPGGRRKSLGRERPRPGSKLRAPGFHTTAQAPRTPEQRDT